MGNSEIINFALNEFNGIIWAVDKDLKFTLSAGSALTKLGLKPNQVVGMTLYEFFQADDSDENIIYHKRVLAGETVAYQTVFDEKVFLSTLKPIYDDGEIVGATGTALNTDAIEASLEAAQKRESYFENVIENSNEFIMVLVENTIKFINSTAVSILKTDKNDLIGTSPEKFFEAEPLSYMSKFQIDKVIVQSINIKVKTFEGEFRSIDFKVSRITWEDQEAYLFLGVDITERENAEKITNCMSSIAKAVTVSKNSNELYKSIHNALNRIIDASNFFIALYNEDYDKISFPYFVDEVDEEFEIINANDSGSLTADVMSSGKPILIHKEKMFEKYSDDEAWGTLSEVWMGFPLKFSDNVIGAFAVQNYNNPNIYSIEDLDRLLPIAEQIGIAIGKKLSEENLRSSEEKFKLAFYTSPDAIAINRLKDGLFVEINDGYKKITGYSDSDLMNKTSLEMDIWVDPEARVALVDTIKTKGWIDNLEAKFRTKDGNIRYGLMSATIIELDNEPHILSITRDIDELKKTRKKLELLNLQLEQKVTERTAQYKDALEELKTEMTKRESIQIDLERYQRELSEALEVEKEMNILKSRFISMVSHEYRTPLTVIYTSAELMGQYFNSQNKEKHKQHSERIQHSVNSMTQLLEDVLFIGKSEQDKLKVYIEEINLTEYIYMIIEEMKVIDTKNHKFNFVYSDLDIVVQSDKTLINQILSNLITNSMKYSDEGTTIEINLDAQNGYINITIADSGIGISHEDYSKIFEHFYRGENVGTIQGTGLGLSIVKRCVDRLSGFISINSEKNIGTTFTIKLPKEKEFL